MTLIYLLANAILCLLLSYAIVSPSVRDGILGKTFLILSSLGTYANLFQITAEGPHQPQLIAMIVGLCGYLLWGLWSRGKFITDPQEKKR